MAYSFTTDHDHGRPDPSRRSNPYRFGSVQTKHGRGRAALNQVNSYLKSLIDQIANAKLRRMQRELALRGIYFDASEQSWVTRSGPQTGRR